MTPIDCCRAVLADVVAAVAAALPGRAQALLRLLRAGDTVTLAGDPAPATRPGWNLAVRLCLERPEDVDGALSTDQALLVARAERFLADCDQLALATMALA